MTMLDERTSNNLNQECLRLRNLLNDMSDLFCEMQSWHNNGYQY